MHLSNYSKKTLNWFLAIFMLSIFGLTGCDREEVPTPNNTDSLDSYLKSMKSIESKMPAISEPAIEESKKDTTEEYYYHIDYYQAAAGYDEQMVMNPQTDVIYPGALIKGESVLDGTYTLIAAKRKPITISTSFWAALIRQFK